MRKPRKLKPGSGPTRVSLLLDADLLIRVDEEAARMTADDEYGRATTRTDAMRSLIVDGLQTRTERRGKKDTSK